MGPTRDTKVLVVEDHALFAEALVVALTVEGYDVERLALTPTIGVRQLAAALRARADLVLLDLDLGVHGDGGALIRPLTRAGARVVVVTGNTDRALWGGCLRQGARTVVSKLRPLAELVEVVRRVEARQPVISEREYHDLTSRWHSRLAQDEEYRRRIAALSPREMQVLGELMAGHTINVIAARWVVSEATVRTQVRAILHKLGVSTQLAAVGLAHRVGWRPPDAS